MEPSIKELFFGIKLNDVFFVGVHCDLRELERRELSRGDRYIGEARDHLVKDKIHSYCKYDYEVDTTDASYTELCKGLISAYNQHQLKPVRSKFFE